MSFPYSRILMTGASGSLGKQLLYEFSRIGIKPIAHVRPTSDSTYADKLGLEKREADLRNPEQLAALVKGCDAVIHSAAWVNFRRDRLTQFTGINTIGTVQLYQAAVAAGVRRFVQVSTVAAVGGRPRNGRIHHGYAANGHLLQEDFSFNLGHLRIPYIMTKRAAEDELHKLARNSTTELVIVNPSIVVAPSRTGDDRGKALKKFKRMFAPSFPQQLNLVDIRDVAPGIIAALGRGKSGDRYILAGDNISARDLILDVSSILGMSPQLVGIPRVIINTAARWSLWYGRVFGKSKISFYPDLVKLLDYDWVYSSRKAQRELGYHSRSLHTTLKDLLTNNFIGSYAKPAPETTTAH